MDCNHHCNNGGVYIVLGSSSKRVRIGPGFAAAILGILNAVARPVLILLTLPLTVVTLDFFSY